MSLPSLGGDPSAAALIRSGDRLPMAPWARYRLDRERWAELGRRLRADPLPLVTLWCDGEAVHALFMDGPDLPLVASVAVEGRRYLSLSPARPAVLACERIVRDLWGIEAMDTGALLPWLDHGLWGLSAPLSPRPGPAPWPPELPEFEQAGDEAARGATQLGIGPVQALVAGPAHLRLTLDGDRIARVQPLLGYAHRGIAALMRGRSAGDAAALASRLDAESGVAHQTAFARAIEAAGGWPVTARADTLRGLMGELERAAMELHQLVRTLRAAGLDRVAGPPAALREGLLGLCERTFGHRLMMDAIVPGGLARLPSETGLAGLLPELERQVAAMPSLRRSLERTAGRRLAGRARIGPSSNPASAGDALERAVARLARTERALRDARSWLLADAGGAVSVDAPAPGWPEGAVEGLGAAASRHGTLWHWVRLQAGRIAALHVHDPVLPLWQALEQSAVGLVPSELPLLCTSFGLSVSGADQ